MTLAPPPQPSTPQERPPRRTSTPRWTARTLALLAAGFVATYLVTWIGAALFSRGTWTTSIAPDRALWDRLAQTGWPSPSDPGMRWIAPTHASDAMTDTTILGIGPESPPVGPPVTNYMVMLVRQGPWIRTLERRISYAVTSTPPPPGGGPAWTSVATGEKDTGLSLAGVPLLGVPIPREYTIVPLWPGFAIVWAILAALLGLLWWAARSARPLLRRCRGLCEACGYSLEGIISGICPECGTPTPTGASAA